MSRRVLTLKAVVVCALLVIACAVMWALLNTSSKKAEFVSIYRGDALVKTMSLSQSDVFEIEDIGMKIQVEDKKVFVAQSSCRCKTCQSFGKLYKAGQSAICLPYKIRLELDGENELDALF